MSKDRARSVEAAQGIVVFVGITLGLIPLGATLLGHGPALWKLVLPDERAASHYLVPIAVIVVAIIVVFALEAAKKRR